MQVTAHMCFSKLCVASHVRLFDAAVKLSWANLSGVSRSRDARDDGPTADAQSRFHPTWTGVKLWWKAGRLGY